MALYTLCILSLVYCVICTLHAQELEHISQRVRAVQKLDPQQRDAEVQAKQGVKACSDGSVGKRDCPYASHNCTCIPFQGTLEAIRSSVSGQWEWVGANMINRKSAFLSIPFSALSFMELHTIGPPVLPTHLNTFLSPRGSLINSPEIQVDFDFGNLITFSSHNEVRVG